MKLILILAVQSYAYRVHRFVCIIGAFCFLLRCPLLISQTASDTLHSVSHSASLTFVKRDLTCVEGLISKAEVHTLTIQPYKKPPIVIPRADLLQVSQGDALLFSAISSWNDVMAAHVVKHEGFVIRTRSGNVVSGRPLLVTKGAITVRHGLTSTTYQKAEILTVDYLRVRPPTDSWGYFEMESPELLFFLPETYYRLMGFEGTVRVRLFDASKLETTAPVQCLTR